MLKLGSVGVIDPRSKKPVPYHGIVEALSVCDGTATVAQIDWASLSADKHDIPVWEDECLYLMRSPSDAECERLKAVDFQALVAARCTIVFVTRAYDFYIVKISQGAHISRSYRAQKRGDGQNPSRAVGPEVLEPNTDARYDLVMNKLREATDEELWSFWSKRSSAPRKNYAVIGTIRSPRTWAAFVHRRVFRVIQEVVRREVFIGTVQGVETISPRPPRERKTGTGNRRPKREVLVHLDLTARPDRQNLARYLLYKIRIYLQEHATENLTHKYAALWDRQARLFVKLIEGYSPVDDRQELTELFGVDEDRVMKDWESLLVRLRRLRNGRGEGAEEIRNLCEELFAPDEPLYNASNADRLRVFWEGEFDEG
ncbi:MAG: hypothetical protein WBG50_24610 [Desulfomonilaceae bacterium]